MHTKKYYPAVVIVLLIVLSCNLPAAIPTNNSTPTQLPNDAVTPPALPDTPTIAVTHLVSPADVSLRGNINYDVESQSNANLHRAPYGDVYRLNRLERPFTQSDMTYLPNLDIVRFRISSDDEWYYIFIELIGSNPNDPLNIDYGVEIDQNQDGFGDILIWARPPYSTTWATDGVSVYMDTNHDSAGLSAEQSDAPFSGNGYDTVVFDQGQGQDPDLAWVRIDPGLQNTVEFAFKQSLSGKAFMWSVWADGGLKNLSMFSYNDRYAIAEAGSPQTDNLNYPIKALYAMDSTCRAAFGFKSNGYEPLICPPETKPTKQPGEPPPPSTVCARPSWCAGCTKQWDQATCTCIDLGPC
ncbi:MAG: hypothetical protein M1282_00775 [Chloroflexi bacterium]|nr:hypothetical protein [Chloroflexota bacterium]